MNKKILIALNIIGLIGAVIWLIVNTDWEPFVTLIGLIGALVAQLYANDTNQAPHSKTAVKQKHSGKGNNVVNINKG